MKPIGFLFSIIFAIPLVLIIMFVVNFKLPLGNSIVDNVVKTFSGAASEVVKTTDLFNLDTKLSDNNANISNSGTTSSETRKAQKDANKAKSEYDSAKNKADLVQPSLLDKAGDKLCGLPLVGGAFEAIGSAVPLGARNRAKQSLSKAEIDYAEKSAKLDEAVANDTTVQEYLSTGLPTAGKNKYIVWIIIAIVIAIVLILVLLLTRKKAVPIQAPVVVASDTTDVLPVAESRNLRLLKQRANAFITYCQQHGISKETADGFLAIAGNDAKVAHQLIVGYRNDKEAAVRLLELQSKQSPQENVTESYTQSARIRDADSFEDPEDGWLYYYCIQRGIKDETREGYLKLAGNPVIAYSLIKGCKNEIEAYAQLIRLQHSKRS